jgi:hypothetical protein
MFNGSQEHFFAGFNIPSGYIHYLRDHNVAIDPDLKAYLLYGTVPKNPKTVGYWANKFTKSTYPLPPYVSRNR